MSCMRVLLAVIFPPFAVVDKGCGSFLIVFILTLCGWIPGVIGALIILNSESRRSGNTTHRAYGTPPPYNPSQRNNYNNNGNGWSGW